MTQKLSPHKVSKMMALYLDGYSQTDIANKLKIDQSTVSLYVSKFKSISEQQGVKAAGEEFGIMDHVEALHSLAVELTKAKLTVEEAKVGLKMELLLQKLGIKQEDYKDLIQACTKMKSEGFINSAVKLNKLEHTTGMTHEEIMAKAASTYQQLEQTQEDLLTAAGKLKTTKEELANIEKQKKLASQELETHMKNVGVNMKRLKMVENLALALKKAGEEDKQVENYIQRQQLLNKAGIAIDVFAQILEKAKVLTAKDDGKELLAMLDQYGSLAEIINSLENKAQSLTKEADDLEHKAELKGELEADIIKLRVEKTNLETCVAQSHEQKHILEDIKNEVNLLTKKKASLEHENANLEARNQQLIEDIQCKEEKVKDLDDLERKYNAAAAALTEAEARLEQEKHWLEILESFLGLVQSASSSLADLEK
ncbi:MAG: hypothetical protein OEZ00_05640, partial [Dehalococcoidia bacterium]|nr:hypothetical protein [Dehalococcoidia bacterium]